MGAFPDDPHIAFQRVPAQIAQRTIESTCFEVTTVGEIFGDSGCQTWVLSKMASRPRKARLLPKRTRAEPLPPLDHQTQLSCVNSAERDLARESCQTARLAAD